MPFDLRYKEQIDEIYKYLHNTESIPVFIWISSHDNQKKNRLHNIIQSLISHDNNAIHIDIFKNGIINFKSLKNDVISDLISDKCFIYNQIKIKMNNYYIDNNFFRDENKISIIIESVNNKSFFSSILKIGTCWLVLSTSNTKFNTLTPVLKASTMTMVDNNASEITISNNNTTQEKKDKIHNDILPVRLSYIADKISSAREMELLSNINISENEFNVYNRESAAILVMNSKSWNCVKQSMKNHFGNNILSNGIIFSFLLPNPNSIIKEDVLLSAYKNTKREIYKEDVEFGSYISLVYSVEDLITENTSFSVFFNENANKSVMSKMIQHKNNNPNRIEFLFKKNIGDYFNIIPLDTTSKKLYYILEFSQTEEKISIHILDNNVVYGETIKQIKSFIINNN